MPKVLALAANPAREPQLRLEREIDEVRRRVIAAHATSFEFVTVQKARAEQLSNLLQQHNPDILHFAGHGKHEGLVFETEAGGHRVLEAKDLHGSLKALEGKIRCVVLNSCFTEPLARVLSKSVDCVVGMYTEILDADAITFAGSFYEALARGRHIAAAYKIARHDCSESDVPKLFAKKGTKPKDVMFSPRAELYAEFVLKKDKPKFYRGGVCEILLTVRDVPKDTLSVSYLLDDEYPCGERFTEIRTREATDYKNAIETYRDDEIRAIVWSSQGGEVIRTTLCEALRRHYRIPMKEIAAAIERLCRRSS